MIQDPSVAKVAKALSKAAGGPLRITSRADAAAEAEGPGAMVRSVLYLVAGHPVLALIAGDHQCNPEQLARVFNLKGDVRAADAQAITAATGFPANGIAPVATPAPLRITLDASLKRFTTLFVPAGHPDAVFAIDMTGLKRATKGIVSYAIASPSR